MILQNAFLGSLVADAVSMPVHWYYDVRALDADYGQLAEYRAPKNPHPDSILWRSSYEPRNSQADILHGQQKYWGKKGVHYHQNLKAGDKIGIRGAYGNGYPVNKFLRKNIIIVAYKSSETNFPMCTHSHDQFDGP